MVQGNIFLITYLLIISFKLLAVFKSQLLIKNNRIYRS